MAVVTPRVAVGMDIHDKTAWSPALQSCQQQGPEESQELRLWSRVILPNIQKPMDKELWLPSSKLYGSISRSCFTPKLHGYKFYWTIIYLMKKVRGFFVLNIL